MSTEEGEQLELELRIVGKGGLRFDGVLNRSGQPVLSFHVLGSAQDADLPGFRGGNVFAADVGRLSVGIVSTGPGPLLALLDEDSRSRLCDFAERHVYGFQSPGDLSRPSALAE